MSAVPQVLDKAAQVIERGADADVFFGRVAAPRGGRRRERLAAEASRERKRAIDGTEGTVDLSAAESWRAYLARVERLERDPQLGLLTDAEFAAALREEAQKKSGERKRERLEEEHRRQEEELEERRAQEERRRQHRRLRLNWTAFWGVLSVGWLAIFAYFNWRSGWPQGDFGAAPTWDRVAHHVVAASVPGTLLACICVVVAGLLARDNSADTGEHVSSAYLVPAIAFALLAAAVLVAAVVYYPWEALSLAVLPALCAAVIWILRSR